MFQISYINFVLKNLAARFLQKIFSSSGIKSLWTPGTSRSAVPAKEPTEQDVHGRWDMIEKYENNGKCIKHLDSV